MLYNHLLITLSKLCQTGLIRDTGVKEAVNNYNSLSFPDSLFAIDSPTALHEAEPPRS
jgi:hypothetical protein